MLTPEEKITQENHHHTMLLHIKDARSPPYPNHYITQLPGKDPQESDYKVLISHQDQTEEHSLYEEVVDPDKVYEDVQESET